MSNNWFNQLLFSVHLRPIYTMTNYIEKIQGSLEAKTGCDIKSLDYRQLPKGGKECYNVSLAIGNINLIAGRFKTEKEGEELVNAFLSISLP